MCEVVLNSQYEAPKWTLPDWITLNWTMRSETKACIAKMQCADKRENRACLKLTNTIFFSPPLV